jgi:hypothetical protein
MNSKKYFIFGISFLALLLVLWYWKGKPGTNDANPQVSSTDLSLDSSEDEHDINVEEKSLEKIPLYEDSTEKQKEFTKKILSISSVVSQCQATVEKFFPAGSLDSVSPTYKNPEQLKKYLSKFYEQVNFKLDKSQELFEYLETIPEEEISPQRLFQQLSTVEDCGDFEEESIMDQVITTATSQQWSKEDKKDVVLFLINRFSEQMQKSIGLHQISAKIEILHNLQEEGIIPAKFQTNLNLMDQLIENGENEFRQNLPQDFASKKYPTIQDMIELKNTEKETIDKIKGPLQDLLDNLESI